MTISDERRTAPAQIEMMVARSPSRLPASVGALAVGFAVLSALATFLVITGHTPIVPTHEVVVAVLVVNALLCVLLVCLILWEVWPLWVAHRRGTAAARLHGRIVAMFCLVAAVPAIVVAVVSSLTLSSGLDRWFAERTRTIVNNAQIVGKAYVNEHLSSLRGDMLAMATDLKRLQPMLITEPLRFQLIFSAQANLRNMPVAILLHKDRTILLKAETSFTTEVPLPPETALDQANAEEPLILEPGEGATSSLLGGIIQLGGYRDTYLFVARSIDSRVLYYLGEADAANAEYDIAAIRRAGVQLAFALMYTGIAFILLLSAIWLGIAFANRMVAPIRRLIGAADQVSRGNLYVQVPVHPEEGDLAHLGQTFNTMTTGLRSQRDDLLAANTQIDARRRFTEAVLSGVTAGVIGLDAHMVVTLVNRSALQVLDLDEKALIDRPLIEALPSVAPLLVEAETTNRLVIGEMTIHARGRDRMLSVRVTSEQSQDKDHGYVVTLDDITDLVMAQRSAAWADVARRIAHEIKNPLTPIQLSAERLKRKYSKDIIAGREVFDQCVDTIIRQVSDIGRMVDEFSSFARMPKAQFALEDVTETVKQIVFLMRVGNPDIAFTTDIPADPVEAEFDRRLLSQAVTNILKNATEAVSGAPRLAAGEGRITTRIDVTNELVRIDVIDNGVGFPSENRQRLLEPYMTTREKGTGLGLAIVRKILEEHGGTIDLMDAPDVARGGHGALVRLSFPRYQSPSTAPAPHRAAAAHQS